jgi:exodeoxyribonuclease V alpha subunit
LPYDILLVDEISMCYSGLFYHLISALKDGAKVILVGDSAQLSPLSWGNLLVDLLEKKNLQINYLTKIMRQALDSGIITDANLIREGQDPLEGKKTFKEIRGVNQDFYYMFRSDKDELFDIAVKTYIKTVEEKGLDNVYLITPRRENASNSTKEFNRKIQDLLLDDTLPYVLFGKDMKFKLGAKIIHRKNNYTLGVMNGEQGYVIEITNIDSNTNQGDGLIAKYGDKIIEYDKSALKELNLAYSITVHLSQGSEADTVIIVLDSSAYVLLSNCLLYSAVTRSKNRCLLLSQPYAYDKCINTNIGNQRNTWTKFFN